MELLIVTGLSGAGKSQAIHTLEDIGYFCFDNIPAELLLDFLERCRKAGRAGRFAAVLDVRSNAYSGDVGESVQTLAEAGYAVKVLFLDAADDVLLRRYKETRRPHPLIHGEVYTLAQALVVERQLLASVREHADYLLDTSNLSAAQLRERIIALFGNPEESSMKITILSFGYKHGVPADADLVFDVRCLPNPFYIPSLRSLTGCDAPVYDYVFSFEGAGGLYSRVRSLLEYSLPLYQREGKSSLVIAFGCTGGHHRSVSFARRLAAELDGKGETVALMHRDVKR